MKNVPKKAHIMIVDDAVENLSLLNKLLTEYGYEVSLFPRAELALRALKINVPDLILLDVNMPGMNGFELCKEIKKDKRLQDIPVIYLSAMQDIGDKLNAFRFGGVDYITKPFQFDEVLMRIRTHIKLCYQQKQLEESYEKLKNFEKSLELLVEKRTEELTKANMELQESRDELHALNEELEQRVEKRTSDLKNANKALRNSLEKLQEDEEAGHIVQFKLLPPNNYSINEYEFKYFLKPSMYMSGDFVDYFNIDENYAAFYIADVSGHGAASAFVTLLLKSFINNCCDNYHAGRDELIINPQLLLSKFNKSLYEEKLDKHISMFYGVLSKNKNELVFANGGHFPFPFMCSDGDVRVISEKSIPVGMFDFSEYRNVSLPLPDDFVFTIFSDGILEILPEKDTESQIKELEKLVSSGNMEFDKLIDKLRAGEKGDLLDDIAVLSLRKGS